MKKIVKLLILFLVIIVSLFLIYHYHLHDYVSIAGLNKYHGKIIDTESKNPALFIIICMLCYIVLIACCIPGTVLLDVFAGFLFGCYFGSALVVISYTIGAVINFFVVGYIFKDLFINRFEGVKNKVQSANKHKLLLNLIGLRLIPVVPFWAINIVAAILEVDIKMFLLSTVIGIIPASVIYVIIGDGFRHLIANHKELSPHMLDTPSIWLPLLALSILAFLPNIIKLIKQILKYTKLN